MRWNTKYRRCVAAVVVVASVAVCVGPKVAEAQADSTCGDWSNFTLLFLHHQKCGGTSVEAALEQFAQRCKLGYARQPAGAWRPALRAGQVNILTGHIGFGIHKMLPRGRRYAYVTVFRDPVERCVSHYNHTGWKKCKCKVLEFCKLNRNYFVHRMLGYDRRTLGTPENFRRKSFGLQKAKANLVSRVHLVGVMSDLASWAGALQKLLQEHTGQTQQLPSIGWHNVHNTTIASQNGVGAHPILHEGMQLSDSERIYIQQINEEDYELWNAAKQLAANIHID